MKNKTLSTLRTAYAVLGDISHNWPGRITPQGQTLLSDLRNAISEETGESHQTVQDASCRGPDWFRAASVRAVEDEFADDENENDHL